MSELLAPTPLTHSQLARRFGLVQATALNMISMVGIGPFITIPLLMSTLGGPQAMLGWLVGLAIVLCDGLVWSELGAAMPASGGSFQYLRQAFGPETFGRLMGFLFVWQFILSGPLEIASGYIGFARYVGYLWSGLTPGRVFLVAAAVGLVNLALLYRGTTSIAKMTVALWAGTIVTSLAVVATGWLHFDRGVAFDVPPRAFSFSLGFLLGLGAATRICVYDYLGYYDVCYLGDEVKDPGRTIPRSIIISTLLIAALYLAMNLAVIGVVPWRELVATEGSPNAGYVVSALMERIYGANVAAAFTVLVLWTALAGSFALLLGYSRIPYAAAQEGYFFAPFGRLHPTKGFPHVALLVIGGISIVSCSWSLDVVIDALLATRILVQFIGQIGGVVLLRRRAPEMARPFRMWWYPAPVVIALAGWLFVFGTTGWRIVLFSLEALLAGVLAFLIWSARARQWPFAAREAAA